VTAAGWAAYRAETTQWPRRVEFEEAHPDARFYRVGVMTQAYVPIGDDDSVTVTRATLGDVLDALGEIFDPGG
jgi:hypothetical protein